MSSNVITPFDPWKSRLCTCPPKMVLSPYVGCGHSCVYCYITSYIPKAFEPRPKKQFLERLERSLSKKIPKEPVELAASSDVYQPLEAVLRLTRGALKLLGDHDCRVQILTKSDLVLRDADILSRGRFSVGMTLTTIMEKVARKLEPNASSPSIRVRALQSLTNLGIPTFARIDPIIPWVNDEEIDQLINALANAGVRQITCSTYKARWDSLSRLSGSFPEIREKLLTAFREGTQIQRTRYLPKGVRLALMSMAKHATKDRGIGFATCREGLQYLNSARTCDGTHLIP